MYFPGNYPGVINWTVNRVIYELDLRVVALSPTVLYMDYRPIATWFIESQVF